MRIRTLAGELCAVATVCVTQAAWGSDFSVAPNGSDSAAGGATAPWATLQHAADAMQPGDTVTVADGTYAGFWMKNRQGDAQHRFVIRAQSPLGAKITGPSATASDANDSVQLVSVSFATIDGFDVTGAPRAGISIRTFGDETGADTTDDVVQNCRSHSNGAGVTAGRHDGIFTGFAQNVLIQNNEVDHNAEHGIYVSNSADNPVVRGNRSHDNLANGLQINADGSTGGDGVISHWLMEDNVVYGNGGAAAVNLDGATFGILRNNLVYGNAKGGIALFLGDSVEASHDNLVVGNTVYDPAGSRFGIQIDNGADNNVVFDNVFWSAASGMEIGAVNNLSHDYNVVSSYSGGSASAHETSAALAQLFVNAASDDYRPGPALIGDGIAAFGGATAPGTDIAGNARPQSGVCDIGCYEHGGTSAPPGPPTSDAGSTGSPIGDLDGSAPSDGAVSHPASKDAAPAFVPDASDAGHSAATNGTDAGAQIGMTAPTSTAQAAPDAAMAGALGGITAPPMDPAQPDAGLAGTQVGMAVPAMGPAQPDAGIATGVDDDASVGAAADPASPVWGAGNAQNGGCNAASGSTGASGASVLALALLGVRIRKAKSRGC